MRSLWGTIKCYEGLCVKGLSYGDFYYADYLLLTSLTAPGLQCLVTVANKCITNHGLRLNSDKTEYNIFGPCQLEIERSLNICYLDLGIAGFRYTSRARSFYLHLLNCTNLSSHNNLIHRASNTCNKYHISFVKYVMNEHYATRNWKRLKCFPTNDAISDIVRQLLLRKYQ